MNQPESNEGSTAAPVLVEDLFVTEVFLIKGRLASKNKRLTNVLEDYSRTFLQIQDATMVSLRTKEVIRTPTVMVNVREILFAHELLELAGDEAQKQMSETDKQTKIRAFYSGAVQFELAGQIESGAYEADNLTHRKYFIMQAPGVRGLDLEHPEMKVLENLEYAIVRKDGMAYVYDFS